MTPDNAETRASGPLVSIALPCFHARIEGIRAAVADMQAQTYSNWELHISDNASPFPEVAQVCKELAASDPRIHYHRQPVNCGLDNFKLLVDIAHQGKFFMWLADDDRWAPTFIETCLKMFEQTPEAGLVYPNMTVMNAAGETIGDMGDFARFSHGRSRIWSLIKYLWEPEVMGKANFLYGLYRREAIVESMKLWGLQQMEKPFGDVVFLFALQARWPIVCGGEILVRKGIPTKTKAWWVKTPIYQTFNYNVWWGYTGKLIEAAPSIGDKLVVAGVMLARLVHKTLIALPIKIFHKLTGHRGVLFNRLTGTAFGS